MLLRFLNINLINFDCDLDANYSNIFDEAFEALDATLRLIKEIKFSKKDIKVIKYLKL